MREGGRRARTSVDRQMLPLRPVSREARAPAPARRGRGQMLQEEFRLADPSMVAQGDSFWTFNLQNYLR